MTKLAFLLGTAVAIGAVTLSARDAYALGPIGIEVGAKGGVGTNPIGGGAPNPLGVGLGGRGGVSIFGLYAGVSGLYYLGGSANEDGATVKAHSAVYGVEAGYGLKLFGLLTIRPQIGVGNDEISVSGLPGGSMSKGYLYLEPAGVALITIGILYVGADVGALLLPKGPEKASSTCTGTSCTSFDAALTVHAQVGLSF